MTDKIEALECTCRDCGGKFIYQANLTLMERFGITRLPDWCDECEATAEERKARKESVEKNLKWIPFLDWDENRGNLFTMRAARKAVEENPGLVLLGDTGQCKTRCLSELARESVLAGELVTWVDCPQIMEKFSIMDQRGPVALEEMKETLMINPVLVLDDLGKGKVTEHRAAAMFDLLDRLVKKEGKVERLWVTSNKDPDQLANYFMDHGRPLVQRLADLCEWVEV